MTRDELAELIGVSMTRRLSSGDYFGRDEYGRAGVKVRELAAAVAADIEGKVLHASDGQ